MSEGMVSLTGEKISNWENRIRGELQPIVDGTLRRLGPRPTCCGKYHIIDVGANVGIYSELLNNALDNNTELILFEPVPEYAQIAARRFEHKGDDVKIYDFALSDRNEDVELWLCHTRINLGWNTIIKSETNKKNNIHSIPISCFIFDELDTLRHLDHHEVCVLKVDVEGYEGRVFNGMIESLKYRWKRKPLIVCEVGWGTKHPFYEESKKAFEQLKEIGYDMPNVSDKTEDMFFIPPFFKG